MPTPIPCKFCHNPEAQPVSIRVAYATSGVADPVPMWRVHCSCGTIGKCRRTPEEAVASWGEPWQAFVLPENQVTEPAPKSSRPSNAEAERRDCVEHGAMFCSEPDCCETDRMLHDPLVLGPIHRAERGPRWPAGYAERALEAHDEALAQQEEPKPEINWAQRWGIIERHLRAGGANKPVQDAFALMFKWLRDGK